MTAFASILLAAISFYNVIPDLPGDERTSAAEAADWSDSVGGGTALYLVRLPVGWWRRPLDLERPLARAARFASGLRRRAGFGLYLYTVPEKPYPTVDDDYEESLRELGRAMARSGAPFVMVDGLFSEFPYRIARRAVSAFREGIDEVDPAMTAGLALSAQRLSDGPVLASILAGAGHAPVMRLGNSVCLEQTVKNLPAVAMATMASIACPTEVPAEYLDDADTSPHNLWSRSATTMLSKIAVSLFVGARGSLAWHVGMRSADGYPTSPAYAAAFERSAAMLKAVADCVDGSELTGVEIPLSRKDRGAKSANWAELAFGAFGIPFHASYDLGPTDSVRALMGEAAVKAFTRGELRRIFRGRVLVDGDAAIALTELGLSELTGVYARREFIDYNCERFADGSFVRLAQSASVPRLYPIEKLPHETLSSLVRRRGAGESAAVAAPASVFAMNALGGTVVTTVYNCRLEPWNLWNEARRDRIVAALELLNGGPLPLRVACDQDVLTLTRECGGKTVALVVNLGFDPVVPDLRAACLRPALGIGGGVGRRALEAAVRLGFESAAAERRAFVVPRRLERLDADGDWKGKASAPLACGEFAVYRL